MPWLKSFASFASAGDLPVVGSTHRQDHRGSQRWSARQSFVALGSMGHQVVERELFKLHFVP